MIRFHAVDAAPHSITVHQQSQVKSSEPKEVPANPLAGPPVNVPTSTAPKTSFAPDGFPSLLKQILDGAAPQEKPGSVVGKPPAKTVALPAPSHKSPNAQKHDDLFVPVQQQPEDTPILPLTFHLSLPAPAREAADSAGDGTAGQPSGKGTATHAPEGDAEQLPAPSPIAFTARINVENGSERVTREAASQTPAAASAPAQTGSSPGLSSGSSVSMSAPEATPAMAAGNAYQASPAVHHTQTAIAIEPAATPLQPVTAAAPVRDIAFQLPGTRGVEIRVSERSGELRVDVRSGDPALTQDLRGNLRELVSGLDRKGFSAEVSHSPNVVITAAKPGDAGLHKDHAQQQGSPEGQNGDSGPRQRKQNQRDPEPAFDVPKPRARSAAWTAALDSHLLKKEA